MPRTMYDSIEPAAIPTDAQMVAGYINGSWGPNWKANGQQYGWDAAAWARFPNSVKVRIAVNAQINDGDVLDVETGDALPAEAPGWVTMRRAATGTEKTVYCNLSNVDAVKAAFAAQEVALPQLWLAHYGAPAVVPAGYVALQYADPAIIPGKPHYDLSVVEDFWLGVDMPPKFTPPPLFSQSDDLNLKVGEVGQVAAGWSYKQPDGTYKEKYAIRKVWSQVAGRKIYTLLPPVDPESDPTECLDGSPAIFVVNVSAIP